MNNHPVTLCFPMCIPIRSSPMYGVFNFQALYFFVNIFFRLRKIRIHLLKIQQLELDTDQCWSVYSRHAGSFEVSCSTTAHHQMGWPF